MANPQTCKLGATLAVPNVGSWSDVRDIRKIRNFRYGIFFLYNVKNNMAAAQIVLFIFRSDGDNQWITGDGHLKIK